MAKPKPSQTPTPPATPKAKEITLCWCGHRKEEHTGPDGMCKFNRDGGDGCDCGGYDAQ